MPRAHDTASAKVNVLSNFAEAFPIVYAEGEAGRSTGGQSSVWLTFP